MAGWQYTVGRGLTEKHHEFGAMYKASAIAQTTIDTYSSATAAYKAMAGIGVVGPILGAAAAAAAITAGLMNVQQIAAQQLESGTGSARGGLTLVGERGPELLDLTQGARVYNNNQTNNMMGGGDIHLHLPVGASVDHSVLATIRQELPRMLEQAANGTSLKTFKSKLAMV
jgi:hypothetical protein